MSSTSHPMHALRQYVCTTLLPIVVEQIVEALDDADAYGIPRKQAVKQITKDQIETWTAVLSPDKGRRRSSRGKTKSRKAA